MSLILASAFRPDRLLLDCLSAGERVPAMSSKVLRQTQVQHGRSTSV